MGRRPPVQGRRGVRASVLRRPVRRAQLPVPALHRRPCDPGSRIQHPDPRHQRRQGPGALPAGFVEREQPADSQPRPPVRSQRRNAAGAVHRGRSVRRGENAPGNKPDQAEPRRVAHRIGVRSDG